MRATRGELVPRNATQVRSVHEQLPLGDAHRQEIGDMVVGDGVLVAFVGYVAFEIGDAVHDASGIVRVKREREEVGLLDGEALERSGAVARAKVADLVEPASELDGEVVEVAEAAAVEKRSFELPEAALDAWLVVGMATAHGDGPHLVVRGEGEVAWIVDRLLTLPAQHDRLLAVVLAALGQATEALERRSVTGHEGVQIGVLVQREELAPAVHQHVAVRLYDLAAATEVERVRRPVALGHLAGVVARRGEAWRGTWTRTHAAHVLLDRSVSAAEAGGAQLLEDTLRGDRGMARQQVGHLGRPLVDLACARCGGPRGPDRAVTVLASAAVHFEQASQRVAADSESARDRASGNTLRRERHGLLLELLPGAPGCGHGRCSATARATVVVSAASTGVRPTSASSKLAAALGPCVASGRASSLASSRAPTRRRVSASPRIQSHSARRRVDGAGTAAAAEGVAVKRRSSHAARVGGSGSSSNSNTMASVWRSVMPVRITTSAARTWLPRGNAASATAVRGATRLRDWYAAGVDVAPLVASLATYLGHAHVSDTYWYLTASPDLLAQAADRFARAP
jgi:hypothetical protein